jgi:haloalkane dehalogenase
MVASLFMSSISDKPARREDYTYQHHVDWMRGLVLALDLQRTTLVGQDWGGFIGLRLAAEHQERFAGIVDFLAHAS